MRSAGVPDRERAELRMRGEEIGMLIIRIWLASLLILWRVLDSINCYEELKHLGYETQHNRSFKKTQKQSMLANKNPSRLSEDK